MPDRRRLPDDQLFRMAYPRSVRDRWDEAEGRDFGGVRDADLPRVYEEITGKPWKPIKRPRSRPQPSLSAPKARPPEPIAQEAEPMPARPKEPKYQAKAKAKAKKKAKKKAKAKVKVTLAGDEARILRSLDKVIAKEREKREAAEEPLLAIAARRGARWLRGLARTLEERASRGRHDG